MSLVPLASQYGRYRLLKPLGEGGMGAVWLALDTELQREVALKVPHFPPGTDPVVLERFKREAQVAARIDHPNFCPVLDIGHDQGRPFYVMPVVKGRPLADYIRQDQPWPLLNAAGLVSAVASALAALHGHGIIHRDIKPANIMIRETGEVVLMDFGLARLYEGTTAGLTATGQTLGTPAFMAPEQIGGDGTKVGPAADVWALGVLLYQLLAGRLPFTGSALEVYGRILHLAPEPPSVFRPDRDSRLDAVCLHALTKDARQRPAGMAAFATLIVQTFEQERQRQEQARCQAEEQSRREQEEFRRQREVQERQQQALVRLREEGEAKLARLIRAALDRTAGKPTPKDNELANELVRQYQLAKERAEAIVCEEFERWQTAQFRKPRPGDTTSIDLGRGIAMRFAWCPPGTFLMGSPPGERDRENDETQHQVTLSKGYWLGIHPVTQSQWQAIMGDNPSRFKGGTLPVEMVSWENCQEFASKLGARTGKRFRLPTEAEWEYACRAGTTTPFHFGAALSTDQANYDGNFTHGKGRKGVYRQQTTPVGNFPANAWGLHDMHGNVWEWCSDWYGEYPSTAINDPQGSSRGTLRVLRGGSWYGLPRNCRSAYRLKNDPTRRFDICGCRVLLELS